MKKVLIFVFCALWQAFATDLRIEPGSFGSGKAYVRCLFDGVEQKCFVDTGSAMSLLRTGQAGARDRSRTRKFHYKSASGKTHEAEVLRVRSIVLDGREIRDVRIGRITTGNGESTLGMDLLGRFPFSMDFRLNPKLRLEAKRRSDRGLRELRVLESGLLAVPVSMGGAGTFAVWDTGASVTAVDLSFVRAHPQNFRRVPQSVEGVDGTGEKLKLELYRARELSVGGRRFENLPVVVLDLSPLRDSVGQAVQAVIGFNVIRKGEWYFDRAGRKWAVR